MKKKKLNYIVIFSLIAISLGAKFNTKNRVGNQASDWSKLLDPKTDEFWKEGNHIPDQGLLIFAKNPNLENAKNWLLRMELKAKQLEKMMVLTAQAEIELIKEGRIKDRYQALKYSNKNLPKVKMTSKIYNELKYLEYFFLFLPDCKHCHMLSQKLVQFPNVIPLQATSKSLKHFVGLSKSSYAEKSTLDAYAKDGQFPKLIILSRKTNQATILKGNVSVDQIIRASSKIIRISNLEGNQ